MGKMLRIIVGVPGLIVISFLGGYFVNETAHQKKDQALEFSLANARVEEARSDNMNYSLTRDSFNKTLSDFGTKTTRYLKVHKLILDGKKDEALENLEDYALGEIHWTEDYLELVRNQNIYSNLVKNVEGKFLDKREEARGYIHRYWAQRGSKRLKSID